MKNKLFQIKEFNFKLPSLIFYFFIVGSISHSLFAQERKLYYDVVRKGKVIGKIDFTELRQGQKTSLSMSSNVKTRYVFSFSDETSETASFDNGVMVHSSFRQDQTGSAIDNKTTTAAGKFYKVTDDGESKLINISPIYYNMLLLYTTIPSGISKVYSANFQKHLEITKVEENKYRLTMPDGKFNYYTYKNGICTKVEIVRTLFTLHFVLRAG